MVRGGRVGSKRNFKKTAKSRDECSDDSDEDYVISDGEEESDVAEDALDDLDGSALEDEIELEEEEEEDEVEEEVDEVKNPVKWKAKPSTSVQRNSGGTRDVRKRKRASSEEDDEDFDIDDEDIIEEEEDEDDDDDDEEFTPEEDEFLDEEDSALKMRNRRKLGSRRKLARPRSRKKISTRGRKRRKKSTSSKNPSRKMGKKNSHVRKKPKSDDDADFEEEEEEEDEVVCVPRRKNLGQRRRRYVAVSDSDFVHSEQSDYEYTISEEEREQVKEASEFCRTFMPAARTSSSKRIKNGGNLSLRGSMCSKRTVKDGDLGQQRKPPGQKGKEKVEEIKVVKQVCGICLSEEDKRRVRGTLDCCSHYFCFTCIIQWSKVESRCPLCKQRFKTLSKPARSTGADVKDVVIHVPERDQVYQPTEEEIRGYHDPYENVICTECHQGGDDGLMLLCDLCDSPAHTYCVGLGTEVPEGNWYCNGCRPVALGSSSSQAQDTSPHRRTSVNLSLRPSPISNVRESLDLNVAPSPRSPTSLGFGNLPSPGFPGGMLQTTPPVLGIGAPTLSGRRLIHRQIQQILSGNRMSPVAGRADGFLASNLRSEPLHSPSEQRRQIAAQQPREREVRLPYNNLFGIRLQENLSQTVQSRDDFYSRPTNLRRQDNVEPSIPVNANIGFLLNGLAGMNSMPVQEQLHQYGSRTSVGSDCSASPCAVREEGNFYRAKEQLQSMVRTHLKNLAGDMELGHGEFKDIARSSTHTILAACGLEHRRSEVCVVPPPAMCSHVERIATGQTSLMKSHCSSCFDIFVRDVVQNIMDTRLPRWLSLGL